MKSVIVQCSRCKEIERRDVPDYARLDASAVVICPKCAKKDGDEK